MLRPISAKLRRFHHHLYHFPIQNPRLPSFSSSSHLSPLPPTPITSQSPPRPRPRPSSVHHHTDDYFAVVQHISNIVRRDFYLERTLGKLRGLVVTADLVYRVIRASSPSNPLEALRFFHWARATHSGTYRPTTMELEELVLSLGKSRHWESMWKTAELMRSLSFPLSSKTFASIIYSYGCHGLADKAVEVFNRMRHFNCSQTVQVYNELLSALVEVKNFHGAYALVRRMVRKGINPDRETFKVLVNGWCSAGKLREAREFLEEMGKWGYKPPFRGRDLLIDGLISAGYLESAKELVKRMTKEGFLPDMITFNSLLDALCQSGEVDFCVGLLNDVVKLGLLPDISTYKIMIPAVSRPGKIELAFQLLHDAMGDGHKPFPSLYAPLIKALCRLGRFADAFGFFKDMKEHGHPPNRPVYTMLVKMCARAGRYVDAGYYLMEMVDMGMTPRSQNFDMVVDGLKHCGNHDLARRLEQMEVSMSCLNEKGFSHSSMDL